MLTTLIAEFRRRFKFPTVAIFTVFLFILLTATNDGFAQGAVNISCDSALPIFPTATTGTMIVNGNTDGVDNGTSGPGGCFDFGNTPSVWYKIGLNTTLAGVELLPDFEPMFGDLQVTLYEGNCGNLMPLECHIFRADEAQFYDRRLRMKYNNSSAQHFLQVGFANGASGSFHLDLKSVNGYSSSHPDRCINGPGMVEILSTSMGSPLDGPFLAGEEVEVLFEFNWIAKPTIGASTCQYLQGVVPTIGKGWDPMYFDGLQTGPTVVIEPWNFNNSEYEWFGPSAATIHEINVGFNDELFVKGGWFAYGISGPNPPPIPDICSFAGGPPTIPGCSLGFEQPCNSVTTYFTIFKLRVRDDISFVNDAVHSDLSIGYETFSDGQTGANYLGCLADMPVMRNFYGEDCATRQDNLTLETNTGEVLGCSNELINITANYSGTGNEEYIWEVPGQGPFIGTETVAVNGIGGNYKVTINDAGTGCMAVKELFVFINESPIAVIETAGTEICEGDPSFPGILTGVPNQAAMPPFSYQWETPIGIALSQQSIEAYYTGTYYLTIVDANGCEGYDEIEMTINPEPVITFNIPEQICPTSEPIDILNAEPSGGTFSGGGVVGGQFVGDVPGFYTIQYSYTSAMGCSTSDIFIIEVSQTPNVTVNHPATVCVSNEPQDVLVPIPGGGTYDPTPILEDGKILANTPGTYTLTYRYGDPGTPCNESYSFNISIVDLPAVTLVTSNTVVCEGNFPLNILQASPNFGSFIAGNVDSSSQDFIPTQVGINEIIYQYTNPATGCTNSATLNIEVLAIEPVVFDVPAEVCQDPNAQITLTATPGNGIFTGDNVTADGVFTPEEVGPNQIEYLTDDNPAGCISQGMITVNVVEFPSITIDHPEVLCQGNSPIQIIAAPQGGTFGGSISPTGEFIPTNAGLNNLSYTYSDAQGCSNTVDFIIDVLVDATVEITNVPMVACFNEVDSYQLVGTPAGGIFTGNVSPDGLFIPNELGVNNLSYGPGPLNPCIQITPFEIEVIPEGIPTVLHPVEACRDPIAQDILVADPPGGTWTGPVTSDGLFQAFILGPNEVTYTVEDPVTGCTGTTNFEIEVINANPLAQPVLLNPVNPLICIYEIVQFCIDPVPGAIDYRWTSSYSIVENATPDHLCINTAWSALVEDVVCVTPIGECGASPNPLCFEVRIIDDTSCIIIATDTDELVANEIDIFPNPSSGMIKIQSKRRMEQITVLNAIGQEVTSFDLINKNTFDLNLQSEESGVYFILINKEVMKKVILINE